MDEELKAHLEAMEGRLMARITGLQEQMLERFGAVERLLGLLGPLVVDHARRLTDLEKK